MSHGATELGEHLAWWEKWLESFVFGWSRSCGICRCFHQSGRTGQQFSRRRKALRQIGHVCADVRESPLVYVADSDGAAIGRATVSVTPTPPKGVFEARNEWLTDWSGMSSISLRPETKYQVSVSAPGFRAVDVKGIVGTSGRPSFLRLRLELDFAQIK